MTAELTSVVTKTMIATANQFSGLHSFNNETGWHTVHYRHCSACLSLPPLRRLHIYRILCMCVCVRKMSEKSYEWILVKFCGGVGHGARTNWLDFGNPHQYLDPRFLDPDHDSLFTTSHHGRAVTAWPYFRHTRSRTCCLLQRRLGQGYPLCLLSLLRHAQPACCPQASYSATANTAADGLWATAAKV